MQLSTPNSAASEREIPYNYTSFSDDDIIVRFLGESTRDTLAELRQERKTGRSARMLFEVLGELWAVQRNPFLQEDLLQNAKRRKDFFTGLHRRIKDIDERRQDNERVAEVLKAAANAIQKFEGELDDTVALRKKAFKTLSAYTSRRNIAFDPVSRVSHATDATDWRVEQPFVVLYPDTEDEVVGLVEGCIKLGLTIIPRGGGTCYTGGAIPLTPMSAVINTEKLLRHSKVEFMALPEVASPIPTIWCEAGVVTRKLINTAEEKGFVFACDPTSADASCVGGNIAMNAGGKNAVLWGTALDNLASWRMVTPDAKWLEVTRLEHNLGKIHDAKFARFKLSYYEKDGKTLINEEIMDIPGNWFRKEGLGKDVSNKFLAGLPGIQKEGCDGIITSARFILHRRPKYMRTFCLEFFGQVKEAVPSIVEIVDFLHDDPNVSLCGLEHMDERYIKAVSYMTKSKRGEVPKMVLLGDIGSDSDAAVDAACQRVMSICHSRDGEGHIAVTPEARKAFWYERSRTSAIAKHTNAFKINEDVVIPLPKLGDYAEAIDKINIEESLRNKIKLCNELIAYFEGDQLRTVRLENDQKASEFLENRPLLATEIVKSVKRRWDTLLSHLDDEETFQALQERRILVSWKKELKPRLNALFEGAVFENIRKTIEDIHQQVLRGRVVVATHMHAGDGNVHTNIPVNSGDPEMLARAAKIVDRIMALTQTLGGSVSGEHGIGLTKLPYLTEEEIAPFRAYKQRVDPEGHFNRHKLMAGSDLRLAYSPSFSLIASEAIFADKTDISKLSDMIKSCLRCGKCKPVCMTHVPGANLLYSPRNKILGTSMLIEAFLYESQTRRGVSQRHYDELADIGAHCTICHKCLPPCPVDIDFGLVSAAIRNLVSEHGKKRFNPGSALSMFYLRQYNPVAVNISKTLMLDASYQMQRLGNTVADKMHLVQKQVDFPPATVGTPSITETVIHFVNKPMPGNMPWKTARAMLDIEDQTKVPIIFNPDSSVAREDMETVFYFPGCGSERLHSQITMATLAMLSHIDVQCVLPPGFLCCGNPQSSNGMEKEGQRMTLENQILFYRIANALNYLDIKMVLVSCGTCLDQLEKYQFDKIFPGSRLMDIHEFLAEKGIQLSETSEDVRYLYHDPCHSPIRTRDPLATVRTLLNRDDVPITDRCCGESGTLAMSRPDISTQIRYCKQRSLKESVDKIQPVTDKSNKVRLLTTCPSCLQGMHRFEKDVNISPDYVVVELARQLLGENWMKTFADDAKKRGIERVVL